MTFSTELAETVLTTYFSDATTFLSLHTSSPLAGGLATGEMAEPTYARQPIDWGPVENKSVSNLNNITFNSLPLATIPYLGVYTTATGGVLRCALEVTPAYQTNSNGSSIYIGAGTLVIGLE